MPLHSLTMRLRGGTSTSSRPSMTGLYAKRLGGYALRYAEYGTEARTWRSALPLQPRANVTPRGTTKPQLTGDAAPTSDALRTGLVPPLSSGSGTTENLPAVSADQWRTIDHRRQ